MKDIIYIFDYLTYPYKLVFFNSSKRLCVRGDNFLNLEFDLGYCNNNGWGFWYRRGLLNCILFFHHHE